VHRGRSRPCCGIRAGQLTTSGTPTHRHDRARKPSGMTMYKVAVKTRFITSRRSDWPHPSATHIPEQRPIRIPRPRHVVRVLTVLPRSRINSCPEPLQARRERCSGDRGRASKQLPRTISRRREPRGRADLREHRRRPAGRHGSGVPCAAPFTAIEELGTVSVDNLVLPHRAHAIYLAAGMRPVLPSTAGPIEYDAGQRRTTETDSDQSWMSGGAERLSSSVRSPVTNARSEIPGRRAADIDLALK